MSDDAPELNTKQRLFVEEYLKDFNATQAAIRVGYAERSAYNQGHRMMRNDEVSRAIKIAVTERMMGPDEVLLRIADIARGSLAACIDDKGKINIIKAKEAGKLHLVKRYSSSEKFGEEIELHDPVKALELLGKNNGALGNLKDALLEKLDMDKLTTNQLEAIARGEDILYVLLNP